MDLPMQTDDLDARPWRRPIVAIPYSRFLVALCAAIGILPLLAVVVAPLVAHGLWPDRFDRPWADGPAGLVQVAWPLLVLMILVPLAIWIGRAPGFAVFPDGIKLPVKRYSPGGSIRDPWSHGFYSWSEVSRCNWSPHQAGVLAVHLDAVDRVPALISRNRVPERHRAAVESAIRACGQWAD